MTENSPETSIIIGGGVGPMAGVALHAKIIEATRAIAGDASHLTVIHVSDSARIPDRTAFLEARAAGNETVRNPGLAMAQVLVQAAQGLPPGGRAVAGVPCNTFHAEPIFSVFQHQLNEEKAPLRLVHMLNATMELLTERIGSGNGARVGILSTNGTRSSRVYDALLTLHGYELVHVPMSMQQRVHDAIYNLDWGIKARSPVTPQAAETVREMADCLVREGVEAIIPACTELPLALPGTEYQNIPLVDPVLALARALVREAAPEKLLPLSSHT